MLFLGLSGDPNEKADELYAQAVQITEYQRIDAMVASARVLIKAGQAEQAGAVLSQALDLAHALHAIEDGYTKASALVDIASELIELGQPEQAGPLLSQALDIANTYPRLEDASWAECEHEGEFICGDFEPRSATVSLFVDIAGGLTKAGRTEQAEQIFSQALAIAAAIEDKVAKASALRVIARELTKAGRTEQAEQIFSQALGLANTLKNESGKVKE